MYNINILIYYHLTIYINLLLLLYSLFIPVPWRVDLARARIPIPLCQHVFVQANLLLLVILVSNFVYTKCSTCWWAGLSQKVWGLF